MKRGAAWALAAQLASQVIRVIGVVILARLLTPEDYGAASLAVTLASYSLILGDLGYGTALVQASTISQRSASTAHWAALAAGACGFAVTCLAAYPAADLLGAPEAAWLVIAGGSTFLLFGIGSASSALLTRRLRFGAISTAGVIAFAIGTVCAILAAVGGAGSWALVAQQVVLYAVSATVIIAVAGWRPSLQFSWAEFASMSRFAMPVTASALLFASQAIMTVLLVGGLEGVDALGIWTFSMAVVIAPLWLISAPVARVIYAGLARMRDESTRVAEIWLNGTTLLAAVMLPALFGMIGVAQDFIPLVFGARWEPAVPIVQILCVLLVVRSVQTSNTSVMDAAGKPHVPMMLNGAVLVTLPLCLWIGSSFGLKGIAVSYVIAVLVAGEVPSLVIILRELSVSVGDIARRLKGPAIAATLMLAIIVSTRLLLENIGIAVGVRLAISISFGVLVYIVFLSVMAPQTATRLREVMFQAFTRLRRGS